MSTFFIAIFAAFCWGVAPAFGKLGLKGIYTIDGLVVRTAVTIVLVSSLCLLSGGWRRIGTIPMANWAFLSIEAFFATFAGDLAYYAALKWGDIGKTALVLAASPFITIIIGRVFFKEQLSLIQFCGAVFIILGMILIGQNY